MINIIAEIHSNDNTSLCMNNSIYAEIDINTGISQGCNLTALLFILVTYKIIEAIHLLFLNP